MGALCLDLANTVSDRDQGKPIDRLRHFADLLAWGRAAGLIDEAESLRLERAAAADPAAAERALIAARELREVLFRLFAAAADGGEPAAGDLAALNAFLPAALSHLRVTAADGGFVWSWRAPADGEGLQSLLFPVAFSAAALLTSGDLEAVRECASATCRWLFLDRSRNRSRRWCDMKTCGNRSKARRHYRRKRQAP